MCEHSVLWPNKVPLHGYIYHILFIHSSDVDIWAVSMFWLLLIMLLTHLYRSFSGTYIFISLGCMHRNGIVGSNVNSVFNHLRSYCTVFQAAAPFFCSHFLCVRALISPCPPQHWTQLFARSFPNGGWERLFAFMSLFLCIEGSREFPS